MQQYVGLICFNTVLIVFMYPCIDQTICEAHPLLVSYLTCERGGKEWAILFCAVLCCAVLFCSLHSLLCPYLLWESGKLIDTFI